MCKNLEIHWKIMLNVRRTKQMKSCWETYVCKLHWCSFLSLCLCHLDSTFLHSVVLGRSILCVETRSTKWQWVTQSYFLIYYHFKSHEIRMAIITWRQSGEQDDQGCHCDHSPSTAGQIWLQYFGCSEIPGQPGPLFLGAGESQVRVRLRIPRPHFWLQGPHGPHCPHWPGTERKRVFLNWNCTVI